MKRSTLMFRITRRWPSRPYLSMRVRKKRSSHISVMTLISRSYREASSATLCSQSAETTSGDGYPRESSSAMTRLLRIRTSTSNWILRLPTRSTTLQTSAVSIHPTNSTCTYAHLVMLRCAAAKGRGVFILKPNSKRRRTQVQMSD